MKIGNRIIKPVTYGLLFLLVGYGRFFNLRTVHDVPVDIALLLGINYGAVAALVGCMMSDLVMARGLLQRKIRMIQSGFLYFLVLVLVNNTIGLTMRLLLIETFATIVLSIVVLGVDAAKRRSADFKLNQDHDLPRKYLKRRPVKTLLETLLRLFPKPEPVGLYRVGSPSGTSPVFVTGNYELSVRRVVKNIKGKDCWLLVCNSRGINIWCATLAGHFQTRDMIRAIRLTSMHELTNQKRIILPQLCASAISREEILHETGLEAEFGPAAIVDVWDYMDNPANPAIRLVKFPLKERLDMAAGSPLILSVLLVLIYNFINPNELLTIIPLLYILSLLHSMIFPHRVLKNIFIWSVLSGVFVFILLGGLSYLMWDFLPIGSIAAVSLGMIYLVNEFGGWSPLIKYSYLPHKRPEIAIERSRCIACGACTDVCPKGVFKLVGQSSMVMNTDACISCMSCCYQCPVDAIRHSDCT